MTRHIRTRICFSNIDDNRIFIYLILILLSFTVLTISEVVKGRSTLSEGIYCKIKKISVFFGPGLQHFKLMPRMPSTRNLVEHLTYTCRRKPHDDELVVGKAVDGRNLET